MNNARAARSLLQAGADKDAQDGRVRPGRGLPAIKRARRSGTRGNSAKPEGGGASGRAGGGPALWGVAFPDLAPWLFPPAQEQTPLFLAAREGAVEVAQLLLELGAARGLRDQAGLAPGDIARQRNHWDLLTLLEGAGPLEARHKATPGREVGAYQRARTPSGSVPPRGGGALPRCRTLSAGACPQARTLSVDLAARGGGAYSHSRSLSKGAAGGGPPLRGRRFSTGMRGPRPNPAIERGRSGVAAGSGGVASADDWPCNWVALGACGPASNTPIPPPCLTPSPERGSPQVAWCSPAHQVVPLNAGGEGQK